MSSVKHRESKPICDHLSMTQGPVSSCLIGTTYKKQVDKLKLVEAASLFCFENDYRFSVKKWILPQKVYRKCW